MWSNYQPRIFENVLQAWPRKTTLLGEGSAGKIFEGTEGQYVFKLYKTLESARKEYANYRKLYEALMLHSHNQCRKYFLEAIEGPGAIIFFAPRGLDLKHFLFKEQELKEAVKQKALTKEEFEGVAHVKRAFGKAAGHGVLNVHIFLLLLEDVLKGVTCLHNLGFAHCDIKPSNIIVHCPKGQNPRYHGILCDLDTLYEFKQDSTINLANFRRFGALSGTLSWMSPCRIEFLSRALLTPVDTLDIVESYDVILDDRFATCRTLLFAMRRFCIITPKTTMVTVYFSHLYKFCARFTRRVSKTHKVNMYSEWQSLLLLLRTAADAQICITNTINLAERGTTERIAIPLERRKDDVFKVEEDSLKETTPSADALSKEATKMLVRNSKEQPIDIYEKPLSIDLEKTFSFNLEDYKLTENWFKERTKPLNERGCLQVINTPNL